MSANASGNAEPHPISAEPLSDNERRELQAWIERDGACSVARQLRMRTAKLLNLAAGVPTREGTRIQYRDRRRHAFAAEKAGR